jgi:hypothetical protein
VYEGKIRAIAWWGLLGLLGTGIVLGTVYFVISGRFKSLETQRAQIASQLRLASDKEGIVISLKQRILVAQKALDVARPWGKLFPLLEKVDSVDHFVTLTIDESGRVSTILEVGSIDEAVTVVTNTLDLAGQRALRSPQLLSLSLRETGTVQLGLSFIPVF